MTRIHSNEPTALAYDGTPELGDLDPKVPAGSRVVIHPGVNDVSDNDFAILGADRNFVLHYERGIHHFLKDDGAAVERGSEPKTPEYVPIVAPESVELHPENLAADPRARLDGEKDKAYAARMKALDASEATGKEVEDYFSLTPDERAAMYAALSPEAKALVDADDRSKATA